MFKEKEMFTPKQQQRRQKINLRAIVNSRELVLGRFTDGISSTTILRDTVHHSFLCFKTSVVSTVTWINVTNLYGLLHNDILHSRVEIVFWCKFSFRLFILCVCVVVAAAFAGGRKNYRDK